MSSDARDSLPPEMLQRGFIVVISGASGSGKSSVCRHLVEAHPDAYMLSTSATTRQPRPGESDGVDYHFFDEPEFQRRVANDEFLEHATVFRHSYGTLRSTLQEACGRGNALLLDIDVQGGRRLRESGASGLWLWIDPPSRAVLEERLRNRRTDTAEEIQRRLTQADDERRQAEGVYDRFLVNEDLGALSATVHELLQARLSELAQRPPPAQPVSK